MTPFYIAILAITLVYGIGKAIRVLTVKLTTAAMLLDLGLIGACAAVAYYILKRLP